MKSSLQTQPDRRAKDSARLFGDRPERRLNVSFEFFPPKSAEANANLWETVDRLKGFSPSFVSVTYGAGGTDQERSFGVVDRLLSGTDFATAAHLTCVGSTSDETDAVVDRMWSLGVRHIVALRGDMPGGAGVSYEATKGGYVNAAALVAGIKQRYPAMEVSVSAYPERHPESPSLDADIDMLAAKVDAGADRAITQIFFDNDQYLRYVEAVRARGIEIPIVPGIMPVRDIRQVAGFAARCGTSVPDWFARRFDGLETTDTDIETRLTVGVGVAAEQVNDLIAHGVQDFHFYSMNRADMVPAICHLIGAPVALAA
jgi:methylenetetrahydrofolate reductase (NADPH)